MDRKIVELLVHGTSVKEIARTLKVGKKRVRQLREQAKEYGYLDEGGKAGSVALPAYPEAVFPALVDGRALRLSDSHQLLKPHHEWIKERLEAGWHSVTVWEELPASGVKRSSFYRYLERHALNRLGQSYRVVPEIVHKPGEALILDWGKLRDVIDPETGKRRTLWAFVGVLGWSRYMMVRLVWRMDVETTLAAMESMFRELGGVTSRITIDNPKCITLEASRYEPLLNPAAERFAAHYGFLIEALPPADPQKKGKVERMMPYVRRLYEAHGEAWHGEEESQAYLGRKLAVANERRHGTTLRRPKDLFAEEAKALKSLPVLGYEIEQFHEGTVRRCDGHVRFASKYYSVGEEHGGADVIVLGDGKRVSIYRGGKLLEVHARITDPHQSKSTKPYHLKPWERAMEDGSVYRKRAAALGPHVEEAIVRLLEQGNGFVDTRKIWGVLSLDKRYPAGCIDAACRRALEIGSLSQRTVQQFAGIEAGKLERAAAAAGEPAPTAKRSNKFVRPMATYVAQLSLLKH